MPVSRKFSSHADLRQQAADEMRLDPQQIFILPRKSGKLMLYVWTDGLSEEEIEFLRSRKDEIKELARSFNGKIAMTALHPEEAEKRESARRGLRSSKYRARVEKRGKPSGSFFARLIPFGKGK